MRKRNRTIVQHQSRNASVCRVTGINAAPPPPVTLAGLTRVHGPEAARIRSP